MAYHLMPPPLPAIESLDQAANMVESARFISAAFTHDGCTPFVYREFHDLLRICDYLLDDVIGKGKDSDKSNSGGEGKDAKCRNITGNGAGEGAGKGKTV